MYEQISRNRRDSWLLMGIVFVLFVLLGYVIGMALYGGTSGGLGMFGVFGIAAIVWSVIGYYSGGKMVLAVSGAHQVTHETEPQLFNVVEEMTIAAGLPQIPAVYVMDEAALNAFATGRDPQHAAIAITRGLIDRLDREELQGVIAHEMSHIRNYDIRFATLVGILVGMIALVSDFFLRWGFWGGGGRRRSSGGDGNAQIIMMVVAIVLAILAPLAAYSVQFAISRKREYLADATGVQLTRNPLGLARALDAIATDTRQLVHANRATAHLFIANPLKNKKDKETSGIFDTHPPIRRRIEILLAMAHAGPDALTQGPSGAQQAPPAPGQPSASDAPPPAPPGTASLPLPGGRMPGQPGVPLPFVPPAAGPLPPPPPPPPPQTVQASASPPPVPAPPAHRPPPPLSR